MSGTSQKKRKLTKVGTESVHGRPLRRPTTWWKDLIKKDVEFLGVGSNKNVEQQIETNEGLGVRWAYNIIAMSD